MKVLLADDDSDLMEVTTYALGRQGHRVIPASNGSEAVQRWATERPDIVLLDVKMPGMTGLDVCRHIRELSSVPIIMLSAYVDEMDLVRGYESGADDYIAKPFSPRQLLLRIDTIMRRVATAQAKATDGATVGDLVVDHLSFEAHKNGRRLALTPLEFRILHCLARNTGTLVRTHDLADDAWCSTTAGDAGLLKTHISHVRRKLLNAGGIPITIRAIPRTGYILSAATADQQAAGRSAMPMSGE